MLLATWIENILKRIKQSHFQKEIKPSSQNLNWLFAIWSTDISLIIIPTKYLAKYSCYIYCKLPLIFPYTFKRCCWNQQWNIATQTKNHIISLQIVNKWMNHLVYVVYTKHILAGLQLKSRQEILEYLAIWEYT